MLRSIENEELEYLLRADGQLLGEVEPEVVELFYTAPERLGIPGGATVVSGEQVL